MKLRMISTLSIAAAIGLGVGGFAIAQHGDVDRGDRHETRKAERMAILDTNQNGQIERSEMETKRATDFLAIDSNRDGGLSQDEMEAHREAKRAERRAKRFARQDKNGDGVLGIDEFQSRSLRRFDRMDANDDGVISEEERAAAREHRGKHRQHGHGRG